MNKAQIDYSTLNGQEIVKRCKVYVKPSNYTISDHMGSGCYGDPPGYPTYFIRHIYTRFGDDPDTGPSQVIQYQGIFYALPNFWDTTKSWDEYLIKQTAFFNAIYSPLPEAHPRVQAWINATYTHLKHCYYDASAEDQRDQLLIYPVPYYKLRTPHIKKLDWQRWSVEYIMQYCAEIAAHNRMTIAHAKDVAKVHNHKATIAIREFYPEHMPWVGLQEHPKRSGNWFERLAEQPTPDTCPGDSIGKHPVNKSWCQCCGWSLADDMDRMIQLQASHNTKVDSAE